MALINYNSYWEITKCTGWWRMFLPENYFRWFSKMIPQLFKNNVGFSLKSKDFSLIIYEVAKTSVLISNIKLNFFQDKKLLKMGGKITEKNAFEISPLKWALSFHSNLLNKNKLQDFVINAAVWIWLHCNSNVIVEVELFRNYNLLIIKRLKAEKRLAEKCPDTNIIMIALMHARRTCANIVIIIDIICEANSLLCMHQRLQTHELYLYCLKRSAIWNLIF